MKGKNHREDLTVNRTEGLTTLTDNSEKPSFFATQQQRETVRVESESSSCVAQDGDGSYER